jgi:hypothetical protein
MVPMIFRVSMLVNTYGFLCEQAETTFIATGAHSMSKRADKIRAEAAALRAQCEVQGLERVDALAQEAGFLLGAIEGLAARLDQFDGVGLMKGNVAEVYAEDDVPYMVQYEYEPLIPGRFSGPPENCYPDEGGSLAIGDIFLNGEWVPVDGFIDPKLLSKWEDKLYTQVAEAEQFKAEIDADEWRQRRIDDKLEGL